MVYIKSTKERKKVMAVNQIEETETILFKGIQLEEFGIEIFSLSKEIINNCLRKASFTIFLPYLAVNSIMWEDKQYFARRFSRAAIPNSTKHEIMLADKHYVVMLLMQ